ncbi:MAG: energy transducer TonB [Mariprofundaceae bacterium]|nr:energy transducer TonB [Mariprofundaceae bacterium]
MWPWVAASLAIHGLLVLWLWQGMPVSPLSAGDKIVEIEMLSSDHHAHVRNTVTKASPAPARVLSSVQKSTSTGKDKPADIAASAFRMASPATNTPAADAGPPDKSAGETAEQVRRHLEAHKFYPASARRRGITGEVEVGFVLDRLGMAEKITVLASSGHDLLDWAAQETVRRAQPFPATERSFHFRLRFRKL